MGFMHLRGKVEKAIMDEGMVVYVERLFMIFIFYGVLWDYIRESKKEVVSKRWAGVFMVGSMLLLGSSIV